MLLRLLGLVVLSAFCSSMFHPPRASKDAADHTTVFTGSGYSDTAPFMTGSSWLGKSMPLPNSSDPIGNELPGDMSVMFPDTSICDVLLNSNEPISIDTIPFFCICSHCKATMGPRGEKGDPGPPGFRGSPGRRGLTGFRGPRGVTGAGGAKGETGDNGEKGQPGPIGRPGIQNERGLKGEKGDHGEDGLSGPLGPQGVPGSCPCEPVVGAPGAQGLPGRAGGRGLPGSTGSKGPRGSNGDKGDRGLDGRSGLNGVKGESGSPGPCNCTNGVNGLDGKKGPIGERGIGGDVGVQGLQGDTGSKGELGDMGFPGIPGPCSLAFQSAFTVALATSFPPPSLPVRFKTIIFNAYDHYNSNIGIYVAPVNGTYVFSINLLVKEKPLTAGLFHNFAPVLKMSGNMNSKTVSREIVLHLSARDLLWVQVKDGTVNGMFAGEEYSSVFSGWLLRPDSCDSGGNRDFPHQPNITGVAFPWK